MNGLIRYFIGFGGILAALGIAVALLCGWLSARSLPRRLRARPVMEFDAWFAKYHPDLKLDKDIVLKVQQILVELFDNVHPTQVLPTDRFDRELVLPKLALKVGVGTGVNHEGVAYFLEDYGVDPKEMPSCETVAQFTQEVCRLVEGRQPKKEEPMGRVGRIICLAIIAVLVGVVAWLIWTGAKAIMQ